MSEVLTGIILNGIQHLVAILVGMGSIYLGYRLFLELPRRREGETKLDLPGGVSILLSRIGPGIFFALFGAGMIVYSITKPLEIKDIAEQVATAEGATTTKRSRTLTGLSQEAQAAAPQNFIQTPIDRGTIIARLNRISAEARKTQTGAALLDTTLAVREAKLSLMREVWRSEWGTYATFHRWATEQFEQDPPPNDSLAAVAYYRQEQ